MTGTLLKPMLDNYTEGTVPGWKYLNTGHHVVANPDYGQLEIGQVPGKPWDQWLFHENNGGGSLVIGYAEIDGELMLMMLLANRFNLKGDQDDWELPGGFSDGDETKLVTAIREGLEETGQLANPVPIPGRGYVGNRAFFQLESEDEGTSVFAFELTPEQIEAIGNSPQLKLMSAKDAINTTRDALTMGAIGRFVLNR